MNLTIYVVAVAIVCLNAFASFALLRDSHLSPAQRLTQLAVTWLLPVVGAIVCLAVASVQARERKVAADGSGFVEYGGGSDGMPSVGMLDGCGDGGSGGDGGGCGGD